MKNHVGQGQSVLSKTTPPVGQQLSSAGPRVQKYKSIWEAHAELDGKKKTTKVKWIEMRLSERSGEGAANMMKIHLKSFSKNCF